jgi:hypothetical protein
MIRQLKAGQRLWLLFTGVLLVSTAALIAAAWPQRDPAIIADLAAPECRAWRDIPPGRLPEAFPALDQPCYSIGSFVYEIRAAVRSEREYDAYLRTAGFKNALFLLTIWAVMAAGAYLLAWSSSRSVGALLKRRDPQEQATQ